VASHDGRQIMREQLSGPVDEPDALGVRLADKLLDLGAGELLARTGVEE